MPRIELLYQGYGASVLHYQTSRVKMQVLIYSVSRAQSPNAKNVPIWLGVVISVPGLISRRGTPNFAA